MGTGDLALVERLDATLDRFGLPAKAKADLERVLALTKSDKKRGAGKQRWILPRSEGGVVIQDDVPEVAVRLALAAVLE
jgi:3-dehydroquinate synthetase